MAQITDTVLVLAKLDDKVSGGWDKLRKGIIAGGAAMSAVALKAGQDWGAAVNTIAAGTGATGEKLDELTDSFRDLAGTIPRVGNQQVADAIANLNTQLGLTGTELEDVARLALKAGVDTNLFGGIAHQMGLDAEGAAGLLEQLTKAAQDSGVGVDDMTRAIVKQGARFRAAGVDTADLTALVVDLAYQNRDSAGLRGALSEVAEEVDKGLIPAITSLDARLGDATGTVVAAHEAGITLTDRFVAMKDRAMALIGPFGDVAGGATAAATSVGTLATSFFTAKGNGVDFKKHLGSLVGVITGPVGIVAALAAGAIALHSYSEAKREARFETEMLAIAEGNLRNALDAQGDVYAEIVEVQGKIDSLRKRMAQPGGLMNIGPEELGDLDRYNERMEELTALYTAAVHAADKKLGVTYDLDKATESAEWTLTNYTNTSTAAAVATDQLSDELEGLIQDIAAVSSSGPWLVEAPKIPERVVDTIRNSPHWNVFREELPGLVVPVSAQEGVGARLAGAFDLDKTKQLIGASALRLSHDFSTALANGDSFGAAFTDLFSSDTFRNTMVNLGGDLGESVGGAFAGPLGAAVGRALGAAAGKFLSGIRDTIGSIFGTLFGTSAADIAKRNGWSSFQMTPNGPVEGTGQGRNSDTYTIGPNGEPIRVPGRKTGESPLERSRRLTDEFFRNNPHLRPGATPNRKVGEHTTVSVNVDGREIARAAAEHMPSYANEAGW